MKATNPMIISIDVEKTSDKVQHRFMIKTPQSGYGETYFSVRKKTDDKLTDNAILSSEKLKAFLLRSGAGREHPTPSFI